VLFGVSEEKRNGAFSVSGDQPPDPRDFLRHGGLSSDEEEGGARNRSPALHSHRLDEAHWDIPWRGCFAAEPASALPSLFSLLHRQNQLRRDSLGSSSTNTTFLVLPMQES